MKTSELTLPEIGLIAATRGMLGAGLALLVVDFLPEDKRRSVGRVLLAAGVLSTLPLVADVFSRRKCAEQTS
ncbi:MAG: hypothetical protein WDO12_06775 [Pseudomonadota bacterium]